MIELQVNGEYKQCQSNTLSDVLLELGYTSTAIATALNGNFIAQTKRKQTSINSGDKLEILAPMQGG